jgi:hypothetical protein
MTGIVHIFLSYIFCLIEVLLDFTLVLSLEISREPNPSGFQRSLQTLDEDLHFGFFKLCTVADITP